MKIAVTSIDGTMEGMVDERFGRARKLILYDLNTDAAEVLENSMQMNLVQGAGIQSAQNVVKAGARAVISGHLGPKAFYVLQAAGIEIYSAWNMTAGEAIKRYKEKTLTKLAGADVQGHW